MLKIKSMLTPLIDYNLIDNSILPLGLREMGDLGRSAAMIQLIYSSTATQNFSEEQLAQLLKISARNNQRRGITGLLVYSQGTFLQVLEGEANEVEEAFQTIKTDARHRDIQQHVLNTVKAREFSQWHMGFRSLKKPDAMAYPHYAPFFEEGFNATTIAAEHGECLTILRVLSDLPD